MGLVFGVRFWCQGFGFWFLVLKVWCWALEVSCWCEGFGFWVLGFGVRCLWCAFSSMSSFSVAFIFSREKSSIVSLVMGRRERKVKESDSYLREGGRERASERDRGSERASEGVRAIDRSSERASEIEREREEIHLLAREVIDRQPVEAEGGRKVRERSREGHAKLPDDPTNAANSLPLQDLRGRLFGKRRAALPHGISKKLSYC